MRLLTWTTAAIWLGLVAGFAVHAHHHPVTHTVYDIYGPAARRWWAGEDVYARTHDYFRYSPVAAIAWTPFALLPDAWGCPLWKVFNCAAFAAALGVWAQRALPLRLGRTELAAIFLLVLPTSLHSMYIGQANLVMLAALLLGVSDACLGRWNRAAAWVAAATLVKGYPLALGLLLVALYPRRFALRYFLALGVGLLLPFGMQRPGYVALEYRHWIQHLGESTVIMRDRLRSVDHLFHALGRDLSPQAFAALGAAAGVAVLGLCLIRRRGSERREQLARTLTLFSCWVVLFGPATESCTYVVLAPAAAWALMDVWCRGARWSVGAALAASLLLMGPLVTDIAGPAVRTFAADHGSQPIGALLFTGYAVSAALRAGSISRSMGAVSLPAAA